MQLELVDFRSPEVERIWRDLDDQASRSFFTSWGWMENWLACLPRDEAPELAVLRDQARPVSAFFLRRAARVRLGVVKSRALYFNITGNRQLDELVVEYNGLVGREVSIGVLMDSLPLDWDELFLPALRPDAFGGLSELVFRGFKVRIERTVPVHFVELARVREQGYLKLLGGQTRSQVKRAQREAGDVKLELASDVASALAIYEEMVQLHQASWKARGEPGAFADPWFDRFHRRLIAKRFAHGDIQLLRLSNQHGPIGALYNFVHRGKVLQYQSGFASFENKHLKPGFLAHTAAIEHAAAAGREVYDFLAGDVRYKKSLGTASTQLTWAKVQRLRLRFLVEDRLRDIVRARREAKARRLQETD
ncbi:MAG: GNAT family N-acetyltransferase [Myxococcales bacterium]|nr:GNAT family N-acetyltransferase [Myxococcales bacterium]